MNERCWRKPGQKLNVSGVESKESTTHSDDNYVKCKVCGFWCKSDRMPKCPNCGTQNYGKRNNP